MAALLIPVIAFCAPEGARAIDADPAPLPPLESLRVAISQAKEGDWEGMCGSIQGFESLLEATVMGLGRDELMNWVGSTLRSFGSSPPGLTEAVSLGTLSSDFRGESHSVRGSVNLLHAIQKNLETNVRMARETLFFEDLGPELNAEMFDIWKAHVVNSAIFLELQRRWRHGTGDVLTCPMIAAGPAS